MQATQTQRSLPSVQGAKGLFFPISNGYLVFGFGWGGEEVLLFVCFNCS